MRKLIYLTFVALATACACSQKGDGLPDVWPWNDPDADDKPWVEDVEGEVQTENGNYILTWEDGIDEEMKIYEKIR